MLSQGWFKEQVYLCVKASENWPEWMGYAPKLILHSRQYQDWKESGMDMRSVIKNKKVPYANKSNGNGQRDNTPRS